MRDTWIAFARTGRPGVSSLPDWLAYATTRRATMPLNEVCWIVEGPDAPTRRLWAGIP